MLRMPLTGTRPRVLKEVIPSDRISVENWRSAMLAAIILVVTLGLLYAGYFFYQAP